MHACGSVPIVMVLYLVALWAARAPLSFIKAVHPGVQIKKENLQVKWELIKRNDVPNMLNETAKAPCSERKTHVTCRY